MMHGSRVHEPLLDVGDVRGRVGARIPLAVLAVVHGALVALAAEEAERDACLEERDERGQQVGRDGAVAHRVARHDVAEKRLHHQCRPLDGYIDMNNWFATIVLVLVLAKIELQCHRHTLYYLFRCHAPDSHGVDLCVA